MLLRSKRESVGTAVLPRYNDLDFGSIPMIGFRLNVSSKSTPAAHGLCESRSVNRR